MGEILSGRIRHGDRIKLEINNQLFSFTIKSVEIGHKSNGEFFVGLLLENISEIDLKSVKLIPQIVEVKSSGNNE
jgi:hypothetical protein